MLRLATAIMDRNVVTVAPIDGLRRAAVVILRHGVDAPPRFVDGGGRLAGRMVGVHAQAEVSGGGHVSRRRA